MPEGIAPVSNPIDLARPFAASVWVGDNFDTVPEEERLITHLEQIATESGLEGTYFVETGRALSIPASFEADGPVNFLSFYGLTFEAPFTTYSIVKVGRIIGAQSVRALCATFDQAILLPYLETIPDNHLLHVPVWAVDTIERTS